MQPAHHNIKTVKSTSTTTTSACCDEMNGRRQHFNIVCVCSSSTSGEVRCQKKKNKKNTAPLTRPSACKP